MMSVTDPKIRVPPLLWVRVFEAAARHENFVAAAKELFVSPGAVSRAVKQLEAFMGVPLFVRGVSGVELTDAARTYASAVTPAIQQIALASAEVYADARHKTLRVSAMPALAQRWLVPKLGEFNELHPQITVRIAAESAVLDPSQSAFDVALRNDDKPPGDCVRVDLFAEEMFPVISPALASRVALQAPEDLFRCAALYDTYWESDWDVWLSAVGLQAPRRWRGLYFTLYAMAVDAAVAGQGVLIGHSALIQDELRHGKLIAPFDTRVSCPKRYYALAHSGRASSPAVRAFLDWLAVKAASASIASQDNNE